MKRFLFFCAALTIFLSGCSGWVVEPLQYTPPPPLFSSPTPFINSPTPVILPPPFTSTSTSSSTSLTPTQSTATLTPSPTLTATVATNTNTSTPIATITLSAQVKTTILSCNTGFDLLHGMGEVTNAYVTVANVGVSEIDNMCATLSGLNEGRPHPDKTKCIPALPAGFQVTFKLTIDSTLNQASAIQVDATSNTGLLQRVGKDSCPDVDIFPPDYDSLGTVTPIP